MKTEVKFLDLRRINARYREALIEAATRVIDSGWYVLGREVTSFEQEYAAYAGVNHCIGVGNGLDALTLILKGYIELGRLASGDKVLVPSNTFIATALAVSQAGLVPVLCPPDAGTYNLSVTGEFLEKLEGVKAVIAVHLYGQLADVEKLTMICAERGVLLIEDAAQAHGASYAGVRAGAFGDAAAFSFFPGKNLGALGDAGGITTNDDLLAEQCQLLRNYGSKIKYYHESQGCNSRLDEIQAAFLRVKLTQLAEEIAARRRIADAYKRRIKNSLIQLPDAPVAEAHVWHLFVVRSPFRNKLQTHFESCGVQTLIHYPVPIASQAAYRDLGYGADLSNRLAEEILSLPIDPSMTDSEVDAVIDASNSFNPVE